MFKLNPDLFNGWKSNHHCRFIENFLENGDVVACGDRTEALLQVKTFNARARARKWKKQLKAIPVELNDGRYGYIMKGTLEWAKQRRKEELRHRNIRG